MSSDLSTPLVTIRATDHTMVAGERSGSTLVRPELASERDRGIGRSSEPYCFNFLTAPIIAIVAGPSLGPDPLNGNFHGAAVNRERCHFIARYGHCYCCS